MGGEIEKREGGGEREGELETRLCSFSVTFLVVALVFSDLR